VIAGSGAQLPYAFCVDASHFSIRVASDCRLALGRMKRYLLPWLPRTAANTDADVEIRITQTGQRARYAVESNGRSIAASEPEPTLFALIQHAVDDAFIGRLGSRAAVHAGVVVASGAAIIVSGPSGCGKTSLVRELLRRGAEYGSDEYAVVDPEGCIHPYPRPLMIRGESGEQCPVLAGEIHAAVRREPAMPGLILFLERVPGSEFRVQPMSQSEALLRLLQNTPHAMAEKPDMLAPLMAAVSRAASFEGIRGEGTEAADRILRLLPVGV
jgi:hypothetical protein